MESEIQPQMEIQDKPIKKQKCGQPKHQRRTDVHQIRCRSIFLTYSQTSQPLWETMIFIQKKLEETTDAKTKDPFFMIGCTEDHKQTEGIHHHIYVEWIGKKTPSFRVPIGFFNYPKLFDDNTVENKGVADIQFGCTDKQGNKLGGNKWQMKSNRINQILYMCKDQPFTKGGQDIQECDTFKVINTTIEAIKQFLKKDDVGSKFEEN